MTTLVPEPTEPAIQGSALCLSGGGYRAMLFHLGSLLYLNERCWLPKLDRISSVSGGSITPAVVGLRWKNLTFDPQGVATNFNELIVKPVRAMAARTIDAPSILTGILLPGSVSDRIINAYERHL